MVIQIMTLNISAKVGDRTRCEWMTNRKGPPAIPMVT